MRYATVFAVLFAAMTLQSCRIEMPSLIHLISDYDVRTLVRGPVPYDFGKSKAVNLQSGFKNTLILGNRESFHAEDMRNIMLGMRIPEKNIVPFEDFNRIKVGDGNSGLRLLISGDHETLRKATRVVALPILVPLSEPADVPRVMSTDILFVLAAGIC